MFDVWLPINLIISALAIKIDVREKKKLSNNNIFLLQNCSLFSRSG